MCLAIPGQIKVLDAQAPFATVEVTGVRRRVNVELLREDGLAEGDWVLIHVGFAMSKISAEEAQSQIDLLTMMGEAVAAREEVEGYRFGESPPPRLSPEQPVPAQPEPPQPAPEQPGAATR